MPDAAAVTVIPIGAFDTCGNEKDSIVVTGWVLDGLLDSKKVEKAYMKLVESWPILSARLRTNKKTQKWEYHLPSEFSDSSPRCNFKTVSIPGSVHDQYKYSKTSNVITCTMKENPDDLYSENGPRSVQDLMNRDKPMVSLQITFFDDATLVGLTTPHVLCDAQGNKEIISALSRVLHGEEVPPLEPGDPFASLANVQEHQKVPPYWRVFNTWQTLCFMACLLWDLIWNRDIQNRELYFPKKDVERIKQEAIDDLKKERGEENSIQISTSDAIVAFCLKCVHAPTTSRVPLNILYSANVRKYITMPKPYLHNGAFSVVTPTLPVSVISTMSLGALAHHIRETVRTQTIPEAVKTCVSWRIANAGRLALFFEPTGAWNVVTNWRDMKLMQVDFSGALPDDTKDVKCVYVWGNSYQPFPTRNCMGLVADDLSGGIWMGGFFSKSVWERTDGFGQFIRD